MVHIGLVLVQMLIKPKAAQDVEAELRRRIEDGEWHSGMRVPPERLLADEFRIARNTLRKALTRLTEEGHLQRHVGRGTFVRPSPTDRRDLGDLLLRMQNASPVDVLETRLIIEPRAAALAASRASQGDLHRITLELQSSFTATNVADFENWDANLHLAIIEAAKNTVLADYCRAINEVRNQPQWQQLKKRSVTDERRRTYHDQHRAIVEALQDRDSERAAEAMRVHLKTVLDSLLPFL